MSVNERTALLSATEERLGNGHTKGCGEFVVQVSNDPADYEPFFSPATFSFALTMDELILYKDDPWWRSVRRTILCSFWLTFLVILLLACFLAFLQSNACAPFKLEEVVSAAAIPPKVSP